MHFLLQPNATTGQLYENAFKAVMTITDMPVASIMRVRHETHFRVEALADQVEIGYYAGQEWPIGELLENEVLHKRDTIVIPDVATSPLARHPAVARFGIRSFIGTPLLIRNQQPYGILSSVSRKPQALDTPDMIRISVIGRWLAHAIEARQLAHELETKNERISVLSHEIQRLKHQIEQGSIRDPITDLFNTRHFNKMLQIESTRAQRHAYPISLLLIYPDGFHNMIHERGSDAIHNTLRSMGVLLRRHLRNIDSAYRYTEELFAILLPQTDLPGASIVAERIRSTIANHSFVIPQTNAPATPMPSNLNLTVSIGLATISARESDPAAGLLARARGAVQQARNTGGNRAIAAQLAGDG
jgi:diguanylate cyclase (GGDEF)-like protein